MKIIIGGPPHSGKSCLRYALKEAVKTLSDEIYPYIITACPDGEGGWYHETVGENPDLGKELKTKSKGVFSQELVDLYAKWVETCTSPLTLIDIGGLPDMYNKKICGNATHAILISSDLEDMATWRSFCSELNLHIIAELRSSLHALVDEPLRLGENGRYYGSVHGLQRGDTTLPTRPTVQQLASLIITMSNNEMKSQSVGAN